MTVGGRAGNGKWYGLRKCCRRRKEEEEEEEGEEGGGRKRQTVEIETRL